MGLPHPGVHAWCTSCRHVCVIAAAPWPTYLVRSTTSRVQTAVALAHRYLMIMPWILSFWKNTKGTLLHHRWRFLLRVASAIHHGAFVYASHHWSHTEWCARRCSVDCRINSTYIERRHTMRINFQNRFVPLQYQFVMCWILALPEIASFKDNSHTTENAIIPHSKNTQPPECLVKLFELQTPIQTLLPQFATGS